MNGLLKQILDEIKGLREDLKQANVLKVKSADLYNLPVPKELEIKNMTVNLGRQKRFDKHGNRNPDYPWDGAKIDNLITGDSKTIDIKPEEKDSLFINPALDEYYEERIKKLDKSDPEYSEKLKTLYEKKTENLKRRLPIAFSLPCRIPLGNGQEIQLILCEEGKPLNMPNPES